MTASPPAPRASPLSDQSDGAATRPAAPAAAPPQPGLSEIFIAFAGIALAGFGGVLAWSRRKLVDERHWLTPEQFNETYALCAFLPGGNILNFSVIFGSRVRGPLGGLVALVGLLAPPMVLIIIVGAFYAYYGGDLPALRRALTGVAAAAAGLMIATVAKMAQPLFRKGAIFGAVIAVATFVSIGVVHWPLPLVLVVILPISIAQSWIRR
jgi:chromate transporter